MNENKIKDRWKNYFKQLLDEENPKTVGRDRIPNQAIKSEIIKEEVEKAMKMKHNKVTGPENISIEA